MHMMFYIIRREFDVFFCFSWRDWSASIIPGTIFAVGAMRNLPLHTVITNYLFLLMWLAAFVYFHTLFNQITGVAEDNINKPDRPIPSGKVSLREAKIRLVICFSIILGIAIFEPAVFPETITCILTGTFLCTTSWGNHWLGKNMIAMTTAAWSLLSASRRLIAPYNDSNSEASIYAVSAWVGCLAHIQDLRDFEGDLVIGRRTMPIAFGNWEARLIISFILIPISLYILHIVKIFEHAPWTLIVLHMVLAYRVLKIRGARYDHKTYMIFTYIFCTNVAIISIEETH